jgi:hypothetical protein
MAWRPAVLALAGANTILFRTCGTRKRRRRLLERRAGRVPLSQIDFE